MSEVPGAQHEHSMLARSRFQHVHARALYSGHLYELPLRRTLRMTYRASSTAWVLLAAAPRAWCPPAQ